MGLVLLGLVLLLHQNDGKPRCTSTVLLLKSPYAGAYAGWVATDMGNTGSELFGGAKPTLTAETSVKGLLAVIDGLTPATSGSYIRYDGGHIKF